MACKKKVSVSDEILEKVKAVFEKYPDKSLRTWQIAEELWIDKKIVSEAIKKLKEDGVIVGRCAYKLNK